MKANNNRVFENKKLKNKIILSVLIFTLILMFFMSINLGKAETNIKEVIKILYAKITAHDEILNNISSTKTTIIWDIRLPRILTAIIVGGGLAVSGAVLQAILMNPLADSYTIGISSGAAFGATIALYINFFISGIKLPVIVFAFIGAFFALGLAIFITHEKEHVPSVNLIIAGLVMSLFFQAAISFLKSLSGENIQEILFWLMGSLAAKSWSYLIFSFLLITVCVAVFLFYSDDINIMYLGDKEAISLGINTFRLRIILLVCVLLITAVCVSIAGIIGFIGLIIPHLLRFLIGSNNKSILPFSILLGGIFLLFADTAMRLLINNEIPIGIITTIFGGPFFIYVFIKNNKTIY